MQLDTREKLGLLLSNVRIWDTAPTDRLSGGLVAMKTDAFGAQVRVDHENFIAGNRTVRHSGCRRRSCAFIGDVGTLTPLAVTRPTASKRVSAR